MAKKKKQEAEVEAEPKPVPKERPKVPKEKNPLLAILTILLILVGAGELGLCGYYGFGVFQDFRAMRQYEAEQKAREEAQAARGTVVGSTFGPTLKVENGTVTWRRETDQLTGSSLSDQTQTAAPSQSGSGGEDSRSRISVPNIPYLLADMGEDEESQTPEQGAVTPAGGASTAA